MAKWTKQEQEYMLGLVKEYDAAKENNKGVIYVPAHSPKTQMIANKVNGLYGKGRTNHSVRKRVQALRISADVFFERVKESDKLAEKQDILNRVYGKVDYETFIKIQSL
jgi:hypothetical protein